MDCSFRGEFNSALIGRVVSLVSSLGFQGKVCVCMDTRPSSPSLKSQVVSALLKGGNSVADLGIGPTPYLSYYTKTHNCLGIMLTASHNPEEDNGIKMFHSGIEAWGLSREQPKPPSNSVRNAFCFRDTYIKSILKLADTAAISEARPQVLIDAGNGAAGGFTPLALRMAGARITTVDAEQSNPFSRPSEPTEETLLHIPSLVEGISADLGIAHDADGDRCRVATKDGVMGQDAQLLNMALYMCGEGDTFVTTVEASQLVLDELSKKGVRTEITPVGSNFVGHKVKELGAVFGGEPCGEYIFPEFMHSADGILSALKLTELHCTGGLRKFTPYSTMRGQVALKGRQAADAMAKIEGEVLRGLGVQGLNKMDGLLFQLDGAKVLIRKSNTQPIIRITCEHKSEGSAGKAYNIIKGIVEGAV